MNSRIISSLVILILVASSFVCVSNRIEQVAVDTKKIEKSKEAPTGSLMNPAWPLYGHDAQNTCLSEYEASQNEGYEKWKYFVDAPLHLVTPVINGNGTLYITSKYHGLHAIYPNGTRK
jgi:hypothetical protein